MTVHSSGPEPLGKGVQQPPYVRPIAPLICDTGDAASNGQDGRRGNAFHASPNGNGCDTSDLQALQPAPAQRFVTPADVTRLYEFRDRVTQCNNSADLLAVASSIGVRTLQWDPAADLRTLQKALLEAFFTANYPHASCLEEHADAIKGIERDVHDYLKAHGSKCGVLGFGSHAVGKVNSFLSDLDAIIIMPALRDEVNILRGLGAAGIVFSDKLTRFDELEHIARTGKGLVRLYGMSTGGIEAEFHVIGAHSFRNLCSYNPGNIKRVRDVAPKLELRVSFTGERRNLLKPSDVIPSYIKTPDGVFFRGFFNDAVMKSVPIYDGNGDLAATCAKIREKNIGATAYWDKRILRLPNGELGLIADGFDFKRSCATFVLNEPDRFTRGRLLELEREFNGDLDRMVTRNNLVVSDRSSPDAVGARADRAIQQLHRLRHNGVEIIASDFDGTLAAHKDDYARVAQLAAGVADAGKVFAIISARDTTFRRDFLPQLRAALRGTTAIDRLPVYVGLANGTTLLELSGGKVVTLYRNEIDVVAANKVATLYTSLFGKFVTPEIALEMAYPKDAPPPPAYKQIADNNPGVWVEPGKLTLAAQNPLLDIPKMLELLRKETHGTGLVVQWSGRPVIDITVGVPVDPVFNPLADPKLHGIRAIMARLGTTDVHQVATFGDTPNGNDRGLLSLPCSFTNRPDRLDQNWNPLMPPFALTGGTSLSPVDRVHRAVEFLVASHG